MGTEGGEFCISRGDQGIDPFSDELGESEDERQRREGTMDLEGDGEDDSEYDEVDEVSGAIIRKKGKH